MDMSTVNQVTVAAGVVAIIQWLKNSNLPFLSWINSSTARVNRVVSIIASALAAQGIMWKWDPQSHILTISGLTLAAVSGFAWHWAQQFGLQEWIYRSAANKNSSVASTGPILRK